MVSYEALLMNKIFKFEGNPFWVSVKERVCWLAHLRSILLFILIVVDLIAVFVLPCLHKILDHALAQWLWYPACILYIVLFMKDVYPENSPSVNPLMDFLENCGFFIVIPITLSIFVFNYYQIDYIWHWVIFSMLLVAVPLFFFKLYSLGVKTKNQNPSEKTRFEHDIKKCVLYLLLCDLFYMSIFNTWHTLIYFLGIIIVVFIFFNVTRAFFKELKTFKVLLPFEFLLGVGTIVYLIYIIPNESLKEIILSIVTSLLGGMLTLLGVAWTIHNNNASRKADMERLDVERKDEERKKYIPYVRISFDDEFPFIAVNANITSFLDLAKPEDRMRLGGKIFRATSIFNFNVKNVSLGNVILLGVFVCEKYYSFSHSEIMEPGICCKIQTTNNYSVAMPPLDPVIRLVVGDILGNHYEIKCSLSHEHIPDRDSGFTLIDGEEYIVFYYDYTITSIGLPELMKEDENNPNFI